MNQKYICPGACASEITTGRSCLPGECVKGTMKEMKKLMDRPDFENISIVTIADITGGSCRNDYSAFIRQHAYCLWHSGKVPDENEYLWIQRGKHRGQSDDEFSVVKIGDLTAKNLSFE